MKNNYHINDHSMKLYHTSYSLKDEYCKKNNMILTYLVIERFDSNYLPTMLPWLLSICSNVISSTVLKGNSSFSTS